MADESYSQTSNGDKIRVITLETFIGTPGVETEVENEVVMVCNEDGSIVDFEAIHDTLKFTNEMLFNIFQSITILMEAQGVPNAD